MREQWGEKKTKKKIVWNLFSLILSFETWDAFSDAETGVAYGDGEVVESVLQGCRMTYWKSPKQLRGKIGIWEISFVEIS